MNKGLRQFLVFFILACTIMLAVLVVQVFVLGEKVEPEASFPAVIGSESPSPEPSVSPSGVVPFTPPPETSPEESASPEPGDTVDAPPPSEGMERSELTLPGKGTLLIDYYPDEFMLDEQDYGDRFLYLSPGDGEAYMLVIFMQGQTAAASASTFFDDAEPDETTLGGAQSIGRTGLIGQYIQAKAGSETHEAWLVDIEGGIIAFSIKYSNETQESVLHSLLDTMRLTQ